MLEMGYNIILVFGWIVVGVFIMVIQNEVDCVMLLEEYVDSDVYYVFEVKGDFMIEVGILDGDIVILCCIDSVNFGDIVVVLIDDEEVILKWLCKKGDLVVLEVVNLVYEMCIFGFDCVQV